MLEPSLIFFLAIFTLGAGLAFGLWEIAQVKRAQAIAHEPHNCVRLQRLAERKK